VAKDHPEGPSGVPSFTCAECGEWVPCKYPVLVKDPRQLTGAKERWVSIESVDEARDRHWNTKHRGSSK
jgi:hypothetical protein